MRALKPLKLKPASGPGSRQPLLKLSRVMPDGARTKAHPLVYLLKQRTRSLNGFNKSELARFLEVEPHSLYKWEKACKADPNFPLPVLRAKQLASYFDVPPALFRPDFPWD